MNLIRIRKLENMGSVLFMSSGCLLIMAVLVYICLGIYDEGCLGWLVIACIVSIGMEGGLVCGCIAVYFSATA